MARAAKRTCIQEDEYAPDAVAMVTPRFFPPSPCCCLDAINVVKMYKFDKCAIKLRFVLVQEAMRSCCTYICHVE